MNFCEDEPGLQIENHHLPLFSLVDNFQSLKERFVVRVALQVDLRDEEFILKLLKNEALLFSKLDELLNGDQRVVIGFFLVKPLQPALPDRAVLQLRVCLLIVQQHHVLEGPSVVQLVFVKSQRVVQHKFREVIVILARLRTDEIEVLLL